MTSVGTTRPINARALDYGHRVARVLFDKRKGHGNGACSYRNLRPEQIAAIAALAFEAGFKAGLKTACELQGSTTKEAA